MDWLKAIFDNAPAIIGAASKSSFGIVALVCLIIGAATIFYLSRTPKTSPWLGFAAFCLLLVGTLGLSVVALYVGAGRPVDLSEAREISFKTPFYDGGTKSYRLLDARIVNIGDSVWREFQERPDGNAEYYHVVKRIEPGRILFGRQPDATGAVTDLTELFVDTDEHVLCFRPAPASPLLQCPYALAGIR